MSSRRRLRLVASIAEVVAVAIMDLGLGACSGIKTIGLCPARATRSTAVAPTGEFAVSPSAPSRQVLCGDVENEAMAPTLRAGDVVAIKSGQPTGRGGIVVFHRPTTDNGDPTIDYFVKRVIGTPGDSIDERNGQVYVDGRPLQEPYLAAGTKTTNLAPRLIPAGQYSVMGDNRENSKDSRSLGTIPADLILGTVAQITAPIERIRRLAP